MSESQSRVLTLVFTDLADSTALKTERGDAAVGNLIARHRDHVSQLAERCSGRIIDWAGDGCFLTFDTSSAALTFALRLQQVHHYESDLPGVRVGIHMGEVTERPANGTVRIEGLAVDLSARIGGLAAPGQVLISSAVHQSAKQRLSIHEFGQPIRWETYGPYSLKGFDEPIDVREAGLQDISPFAAPTASDKAWPATSDHRADVVRTPVDSPNRKLAVLPLSNLSGDPGQEYFADGMTESITAELAKIKALHVISRTSVMRYKNTSKPLREIAHELGVDALVEGSVLRAGNDVRITAQLIRASTDEHLWAESYDGTMEHVLRLQKDVALAIVKEIDVAITGEERQRISESHDVDPRAYELYIRGRRFGGTMSPQGIEEGIALLKQAIAIDPDFFEAYGWLSYAYWQQSAWTYGDTHACYVAARSVARQAVRLNPNYATAQAGLGWIAATMEWDWAESEYRFRRTIEMEPNSIWAWSGLSQLYVALGRTDEALAHNKRLQELDPRASMPIQHEAHIHYMGGDLRGAHEKIQKAIGRNDRLVPNLIAGIPMAAMVGDIASAEQWADRAVEIAGEQSHVICYRGIARALAGDREEGERTIAILLERLGSEPVAYTDLGNLYLATGRQEEALTAFERACDRHEMEMIWANVAPHQGGIRRHPRFQAILDKMNFPDRGKIGK